MKFNIETYSSKGPRDENQDRLKTELVKEQFMTASIADGVGGNKFGNVAAEKAIEFFHRLLIESSERTLESIFGQVQHKIRMFINDNPDYEGMLTTLTGCVISNKHLWFGHVGDTRLYILSKETIKCLTHDQTEAGELIRSGELSIEDLEFYPQKNILTEAIGTLEMPNIQSGNAELKKDDVILLTSDGVHDLLSDVTMLKLYMQSKDISEFSKLIQSKIALEIANDNYSFICIEQRI